MGGFGSGNRIVRSTKRVTVEESLGLDIGPFREGLGHDSTGTIIWKRAVGSESKVGYSLKWNDGFPSVILQYQSPDDEEVRLSIRFQTSPTNFDGRRWWFTCPLTVDGVACGRRAKKLYLPPGAKYFGCLACHNLGYQSSRDSQDWNRVQGKIDSITRFLERKAQQLDAVHT